MSWLSRFFGQLPRDNSSLTIDPVETYSDIDDTLYPRAISFVLESKITSVSALQRHLKVGYSRAARLIDAMEFDGVVSPLNAAGERVLLSTEQRGAHVKSRKFRSANSDVEGGQIGVRDRGVSLPDRTALPPLTGRIKGTKNIGFNIVGESYCQPALRRIRNSTNMAEDNEFDAFIVTEPDNPHDANACAVYIDGFKVGYLPRDDAASYVEQMTDQGVAGVSCFQLRAKLVGGFGDKPNVGVMVNLPTQ
ncbi:DNA translocase FtsK [Pseudomonas sp. A-RE-19]|uniref:DNA translocase FtsK n=1 Tax=Pseudomonas sp. A-RE-19 TaxID=2832401 RepID=UPI00295845C4|nr:DNA translocase FtsK [Pseudomonas sp. A-RE-19]